MWVHSKVENDFTEPPPPSRCHATAFRVLTLHCSPLSLQPTSPHPSKPLWRGPWTFPLKVNCSSFRSPLSVHAIGGRSYQIVIMYFHISFSHQRKLSCDYLWGPESGSFASFLLFVQSLGRIQLFAASWTAARQTSLSTTISWSLLKLISIELMMPSNCLIFSCPLLLLPSVFPSIRISSNESPSFCTPGSLYLVLYVSVSD